MGLMVAQAQQQQWMQQQSHVCLSKDVSLSVTCGEEDEEDDKRLLLKPKTPETVQIWEISKTKKKKKKKGLCLFLAYVIVVVLVCFSFVAVGRVFFVSFFFSWAFWGRCVVVVVVVVESVERCWAYGLFFLWKS
jgi:hypothetical protein